MWDKECYIRASVSQTTVESGWVIRDSAPVQRDGRAVCMRCIYLSVECNQRGQRDSVRGSAWYIKRSGSRNLSDGYLFFHTGGLWCNRCRYSAIRDQEDHHCLQSIFKCSRSRCICQRDFRWWGWWTEKTWRWWRRIWSNNRKTETYGMVWLCGK